MLFENLTARLPLHNESKCCSSNCDSNSEQLLDNIAQKLIPITAAMRNSLHRLDPDMLSLVMNCITETSSLASTLIKFIQIKNKTSVDVTKEDLDAVFKNSVSFVDLIGYVALTTLVKYTRDAHIRSQEFHSKPDFMISIDAG
jgi:hypothetical protein